MRIYLFCLFLVGSVNLRAQSVVEEKPLSFSGYLEPYYTYDFGQPENGNRPPFVYAYNRHNEFNINLAFLKASYTTGQVRASLALAAGTYMNANYAAEPGVLKNIYEAQAGVRLSRKHNLWIDAGIFGSHIGFESAIGKDCWTLTRSIMADNTPYYEAGARITYTTDNGKWLFSLLALNGWQRITRVEGNSMVSWGTQVQYKPNDRILLNYSTFIGTDKPDSARLIRVLHNIYGIFSLTDKLGLTLGVDIGTEEKSVSGNGVNTWYSPIAILRYGFHERWAIAGRLEYYNDEQGVIIPTGTPNGFQTVGYSVNLDYSPVKNVLVRFEARQWNSKDPVFTKNKNAVNLNSFLTGSIAFSF